VTRDRSPRLRHLAAGLGTIALVGACSGAASPSPSSPAAGGSSPPPAASGDASPAATTAADCEGGYPNEDITWIVPYSPGGGFDTWSRLVAPFMEKHLPNNPTVVVENKSGAGGLVGVTEAYGADPDGYTVAITEPGILATSQIAGTTEIDPAQLRAVGRVTVSPEVMVVAGDSAWDSIEDVQAEAESRALKMANGGIAAINVVTLDELGIPWESVFHEGSSESILSLVRGDTDFSIFPYTSLLEGIQAGDTKPVLLIGTKPSSPDEPGYEEAQDVPTLDEATGKEGLGAALEQHRIVVAPPGTPDCVVDILSDALQASLEDPELLAQAEEAGLLPVPLDAAGTQEIVENTVTTLNEYADLLREKLTE
jgi:tripartite-type tricarboxylate transporter receptor subunit TctC